MFVYVMLLESLAVIGMLLAGYLIYVERRLFTSKRYKPLCDISKTVSCSKAILSPYGHLIGRLGGPNVDYWASNAFFGFLYYILVFVLAIANSSILLPLSLLAVIASAYLFYVSHYKMKNYCVICMGAYVVNIGIFIVSLP